MTKLQHTLKNHVAVAIDASSSMRGLTNTVIRVADELIAHLAAESKRLNQETRVSVYVFADNVECLVYETDVLRLPSIAGSYVANGWTALLDATVQSIDDLQN